ncbi:MAG TPA: AMP-binding protein, partial [Thermodesulfovibrionales bacterium]|nr:AMP-binding protein [Thermodesulfovibrionales bacterium]
MIDNVIERFLSVAGAFPDNISFSYFRDGWKNLTYRQVAAAVAGIASSLVQAGIRKTDRIAIICENRPEWCSAYLATLRAGGISVPIDAQLSST